jgi:hypothetical protein
VGKPHIIKVFSLQLSEFYVFIKIWPIDEKKRTIICHGYLLCKKKGRTLSGSLRRPPMRGG